MTADPTQSPAATVRNLIRDLFHLLDRLQGAATRRDPLPDLSDTIGALKSAHNTLQRAFERLTHIENT